MNQVTLIGHLGKDPEMKFTDAGKAILKFPVATSRRWKNEAGEKQEQTEWHNIVVFDKLAEICNEHLSKGRQVGIHGRIQTREYEKDGERKFFTEVVANEVEFLGKSEGGSKNTSDAPF